MKTTSGLLLLLASLGLLPAEERPQPVPAQATLSVDYDRISITKLLSDIAHANGKTLHLQDELYGTTSIKLREVTWQQVFTVVLAPIRYGFYETGNDIHVLSEDELAKLPWRERHVAVLFQKPEELAEALRKCLKQDLVVQAKKDSLLLGIHPKTEHRVLQLLAELDRPDVRLFRFPGTPNFPAKLPTFDGKDAPHGLAHSGPAETRLFQLDWVDCEVIQAVVVREIPDLVKVTTDFRSNLLIITGKPGQLHKAKALVAYLDDKKWYTAE